MRELPTGTVTFLFTDIEGSTKLLHELGDAYAPALAEHRRILRAAFAGHMGVEVDTQGDAFFVAFARAGEALAAAVDGQTALASGPIRVRMGIHTGEPLLTEEGYIGIDVHRAARIAAVGHGGQVLVSQATRDLVAPDGLRDLGEHRLKDLSAPERIYQVGEGEFPPLKSLYRTNLPIPATPFVGREHELAEVRQQLERPDVRLLTLTGPGGTGKTRLALQAAAELAELYPDGVWWVSLAPVSDAALVLSTAGQALGVKGELAQQLVDRRLLLVLDNFEHVIEAAPNLGAVLRACPNATFLVTSRERLQIDGEHEYAVPALALQEGVELFVARANALGTRVAGDAATRELCARLDNLPLALELAAARTKLFSPVQLLDRLGQRLDLFKGGRDADPRQRTLRATIEWSYELLNEEEQRLFARLAVFRGGCNFEAAEYVAEADPDALQSLLEKSLIRRREGDGEPRYWMLETIQEFALERLAASGEAALRRTRHAECLLSLLTRGQEHPFPQAAGVTTSTAIVERVEGELDNVRAALAWFVETAADENAARLLLWAFVYWLRRGPLPEIRASFEQILERELPGKLRQWLLWALCQIARLQADGSRERSAAAEYLALSRRLDPDGPLVLEGLRDLGLGYGLLGDFERMAALHEEALTEAQARGYRDRRVTILINNLGYCELMLGNPARSREFARRALDLAGELGDDHDRAGANAQMAAAFLLESRHNEARPLILDALHLARESESRMDVPEHLECLAICEAAEGRARRATRLLGAAETLRAELGVGQTPEEAELFPLPVAELRSELGDDEYDAAFAEGAALGLEQAIDYACAR